MYAKQARLEAEKKRVDALNQEITGIQNRYRLNDVLCERLGESNNISIKDKYINKEVNTLVRQYVQHLASICKQYENIKSSISAIIDCSEFDCIENRLRYLHMKEPELNHLKDESAVLCQEYHSHKIRLLNENSDISNAIHEAFDDLIASKICYPEGIVLTYSIYESNAITKYIIKKEPDDLNSFVYDYNPIILKINELIYCLFSRVVLVFDINGHYVTALDVASVNILVERKSIDVFVMDDITQFPYHSPVNISSKKVYEGKTITRWLYPNRDGSPDMRRKNNKLIQARTDTYEYATITIAIAEERISICTGSEKAIESCSYAGIKYSNNNYLHNPINCLINLLQYVLDSDNNGLVLSLPKEERKKQNKHNYYCEEIIS